MNTERKEGYYWVEVIPGEKVIGRWMQGIWHVIGYGSCFLESEFFKIHETRIPSPDEADNLQWLFNDLVRQGLKFTYDPATKTCGIFHKEPPRIIEVTVSAGFDFDNKNKADA